MAGFTSYDDLIAKISTDGQGLEWHFYKYGTSAEGAGQWHSLWTANGSPGAGSDPTTTPGTSHTNANGAIYFANQSPSQKHVLTFGAAATSDCTLMLYDRLVGVQFSMSGTGNKTISSTALPRYTSGVGVEPWIEFSTSVTGITPSMTLNSYTNQAAVGGQSGSLTTFAATPVAGTMGPLTLQAGDTGVQAVSTLNNNVSAAFNANLLLIKPLAFLPLLANQWNERDLVLQTTSLPRVFDGASLGMAYLATSTAATTFYGMLRLAYG